MSKATITIEEDGATMSFDVDGDGIARTVAEKILGLFKNDIRNFLKKKEVPHVDE